MHHLADYLELMCLTDPDREYAVERLADKLTFADDLQETSADAQDADRPDVVDAYLGEHVAYESDLPESPGTNLANSMGDGDSGAERLDETRSDGAGPDEQTEADDEERHAYEIYGREAELRDERRRWCDDLFAHIIYRAETLADGYPYQVSESSRTLELRSPSPERLFYIYLLLCSCLRYIPKTTRSKFTSSFEVLSADILRGVLPSRAVVDVFGTARGAAASQFSGSLYKRIGKLANSLGGKRHVSRKDFHPKDSADNGLDVAAWIPLPQGREGIPAFFGQCACGTGWRGKQHEADYLMRWKNYLTLSSPPTTVTFIPFFFRKPGGHWYAASDVDTVLFDRLRVFLLAQESQVSMRQETFELAHAAWGNSVDGV